MKAAAYTVTTEELLSLAPNSYVLYDVRGEVAYSYGSIPDALNCPAILSAADRGELPCDKQLILFSEHGKTGESLTQALREKGLDTYNLKDGYEGWLRYYCNGEERAREVEQSLTKRRRFKEKIFHRFTKAIVEFDMIQPGDKIAVCISGGKDSMLMAKLFQELKRHDKFPFELVFLVMDPGYNEINRLLIEHNARMIGVPITVFETSIFDAVYQIEKSPCYLCARMRRGWLYKKARELGCNKIALGHHYDDVIETTLMGMLWGGQVQTMMPKLRSTNYEGMELIRPLYYVREDEIKAWRDENKLHFLQCACRFTEECALNNETDASDSKRLDTKRLIRQLKKTNPHIEANLFNSMHNVNVDTVIAYKKDGVVHHFLDAYNKKNTKAPS
ncbi:ATP-binding protein [uncultured Ruminococcus sp.]|uniref:ATP-binding protein n=1 Tax=uncultured Ruminococcus sp. TaxID=165186 RepID=UPI00292F606C|nr:ATP-binding protein [uncultured Ruminococcus sp.]